MTALVRKLLAHGVAARLALVLVHKKALMFVVARASSLINCSSLNGGSVNGKHAIRINCANYK